MANSKIPMSIHIAKIKTQLNKIVNHPDVEPAVIELLLDNAHKQSCINAEIALDTDIKSYKEILEKEGKENGV